MQKAIYGLFVATLYACLCSVMVQTWREPTLTTTENHRMAPFPEVPHQIVGLENFIPGFENWWDDAIHYRQQFIQIYNTVRAKFGISPQRNVIIGKSGWLFYNDEGSIDDYRNARLFSPEEIRHWHNYLVFRHTDAQKHGAIYAFMVAPNKERIYSEFLPDYIKPLSPITRFDQIIDSLHDTPVRLVDLRPALIAAKQKDLIYFKLDTHWNLLGANIAQYVLLQRLQKDLPDLHAALYPSSAFFEADPLTFHNSGMNYYSGLKYALGNIEIYPDTKAPLFISSPSSQYSFIAPPIPKPWASILEEQKKTVFQSTSNPSGKYRAVIYRDSFTEALIPFLSSTLKLVHYVALTRPFLVENWNYYIEQTKPDIILDETVERHLSEVPQEGVDYPVGFDAAAALKAAATASVSPR